MSTLPIRQQPGPPAIPLLENGDRLTQEEFHRRYMTYPKEIKAELIEGVVYMASPLRLPHATQHPELSCIFCLYKAATPGVEVLDNGTLILGESNEVQADMTLRVLPEWGGRSRTTKENYVRGGPELLAEIAHSTRTIDLHGKRVAYERAGVLEYLVLCLEDSCLVWFDFGHRKEIKPDRAGLWKSRVFPGLWIDGAALLARDTTRLVAALQQGLAHRAHAVFVRRLKARRPKQ